MGLFTSFQLKSKDPATRRKAASSLGVPGKSSSIDALAPLLEDSEWSVREAAAGALGAIGNAAAARLLLDAARKADGLQDQEGAHQVRRAVAAALGRLGTGAVPALLEALGDRHVRVREAAIEALGSVGGADSSAALAAALNDDRSSVRQAAAPALARAGGESSVRALRGALAHKDPATRRAAALALGTVRAGESARALREAVKDRDRAVRDAAVQSLVALASPEAVGVLCAMLLEGDRDLKAAAAGALRGFDWSPADSQQRVVHAVLHGRYADAAREGDLAFGPLVASLADRDHAARRGAAEALGAFHGDRRAADALAPLLADADPSVRDAVVAAMSGVGPAASHAVARALEDRASRPGARRALAAVGPGTIAATLAAPLQQGEPMTHGALPLRVVSDRQGLDAARLAADHLAILLAHASGQLPVESLRALAALDDVMLLEPGRVPDPDERVSCEALRKAASRELARGPSPATGRPSSRP